MIISYPNGLFQGATSEDRHHWEWSLDDRAVDVAVPVAFAPGPASHIPEEPDRASRVERKTNPNLVSIRLAQGG